MATAVVAFSQLANELEGEGLTKANGERIAGVVHPRRPSPGGPPLGHGRDGCPVGDEAGLALEHEVEVVGGDAQGAAGIAGEVAALPAAAAGLEPEGAVDPERADAGDVRAAVAVDRRQPTGVAGEDPRRRGAPV